MRYDVEGLILSTTLVVIGAQLGAVVAMLTDPIVALAGSAIALAVLGLAAVAWACSRPS